MIIITGCGGGGGSSSGGGSVSSNNVSTGSVTLSWSAPLTNADGSPISDLAGYKVYYGTSSNNYTHSVTIGNYTSTVVSNLSSGTWCFSVSSYDTSGNESEYSDEVCTSI